MVVITPEALNILNCVWPNIKQEREAITQKKRLPVKLVYYEEFQRIDEAFYREKQIQGWSRKKKEALINNMSEELQKLSECLNDSHYKNKNIKGGFDSAQPPESDSAQPPDGDSAQPPDGDPAQPPESDSA